jgi:hypothetical protein
MQTSQNEIPVERINQDCGAREPDLAHKWATSMQPRFTGLVQVNDGPTRNLQTVLFCESANKDIRLRAKYRLECNALDRNDEASAVLQQWQECGLSIYERGSAPLPVFDFLGKIKDNQNNQRPRLG